MSGFVEAVGAFALTFATHGTVLLGLALAIHALCRRADVLRETAWRAALLGGVATAALTTAFAARVPGGPAFAATARPGVAVAGDATPRGAPAAAPQLDRGGVPPTAGVARGGTPTFGGDVLRRPAGWSAIGSDAPFPPDAASTGPTGWSVGAPRFELPRGAARIAGLVALAAAVVGLARLGLRRVALRRLLADRREVLDTELLATLRRLADRAGLLRIPRLTTSARLDVPIAFGTLHPEICVPARAHADLSPAAREAMLAHELAHLAGRDPLWLELAHTLEALFPWQPLLGVARRRLDALAEYRCDAVGGAWSDPLAVADCLVDVAAWLGRGRGRVAALGVAGMASARAGLADRVDRLLDDPTRGVPRRGVQVASIGVAALALAAGAAALPALTPPQGSWRSDRPVAEAVPALGEIVAVDAPVRTRRDARSDRAEPAADGDASVAPADLPLLAMELELAQLGLTVEVEALRAEIASRDDAPDFDAALRALDQRIAAIDARRRALANRIDTPADPATAGSALPFPEISDRAR